MRFESSVTAISWIPSEAIEGMPKLPFELGIGHYDEPPPDRLEEGDLERLRDEDRFREANHLKAWIEVEDGKIVGHGQEGGGLVGVDDVPPRVQGRRPGRRLRHAPAGARGARQLRPLRADGRRARGVPGAAAGQRQAVLPHPVRDGLDDAGADDRADGESFHEVLGASAFPRHWIYDRDGNLVKKSGTVDFKAWYREAHGENTPWGGEESDAFVTVAESAFERELSRDLMTTGIDLDRRDPRGGRHADRAGRAGRRALPRPRRRPRCDRGRGRGRGDRSGRHRRRAGVARGRQADGDARGPHGIAGRRRPGRARRSPGARGSRRGEARLTGAEDTTRT